jgi:NAD(P)-dependent dehydrogenase (short-subunit alcohol dehydrogenase family)
VAASRLLTGSAAYGATKAGQINLLESLRIQVARRGFASSPSARDSCAPS